MLKTGRVVAFVATGLIFLAALVDALLFFGVTAGPPPDPLFFEFDYRSSRVSATTALDPSYLEKSWQWNLDAFPSMLASDFLLAIGLFCVAYVSWVLTKAYRATGGMAAKIMLIFFMLGAVVPAVGFLQNLGSTSAGDRIFSSWSDPYNAYATENVLVALELSFLMSMGRSVWIQATLYILLGGGFWFCGFLGLIHSSELRQVRLPRAFKWHSIFSFIIGFLGFVVFAVDVAKFFVKELYVFYGFLTVIYLVLMIPAWTVWLGLLLPKIPSDFMKGSVVVSGPAYADLASAHVSGADDMSSVEMEELPEPSDDNVVDSDGSVEISLE